MEFIKLNKSKKAILLDRLNEKSPFVKQVINQPDGKKQIELYFYDENTRGIFCAQFEFDNNAQTSSVVKKQVCVAIREPEGFSFVELKNQEIVNNFLQFFEKVYKMQKESEGEMSHRWKLCVPSPTRLNKETIYSCKYLGIDRFNDDNVFEHRVAKDKNTNKDVRIAFFYDKSKETLYRYEKIEGHKPKIEYIKKFHKEILKIEIVNALPYQQTFERLISLQEVCEDKYKMMLNHYTKNSCECNAEAE